MVDVLISSNASDKEFIALLSPRAPRAAEKFQRLCERADDAYGALRLIGDRKREARARVDALCRGLVYAKENRDISSGPVPLSFPPDYDPRVHGEPNSPPRTKDPYKPADPIEAQEAMLAEAEADLEKLHESEAARSTVWNMHLAPVERAKRFFSHLPVDVEIADCAELPKVSVKRPGFEDVERLRGKIAKLKAHRHGVRSASWPSADLKHIARGKVEALRKRGPHLMGFVEDPKSEEIEWPAVRANLMSTVVGEGVGGGFARGTIVDTLGLLAWLMPDQLTAALEREIDALSDDENALDEVTRAKRENELAASILAAEREEEALIDLAWSQRTDIGRRADADPRAVLGLANNLPAPRET